MMKQELKARLPSWVVVVDESEDYAAITDTRDTDGRTIEQLQAIKDAGLKVLFVSGGTIFCEK